MTKHVLVSGQSNALVRETGGPDWGLIDSDVTVWNNINPLGSNGTAFVSASAARTAGVFDETDGNAFSVWFCDRLSRELDEPVQMAIVARGGSSIELWDDAEATYPMLDEIDAVWTASGQPVADVFLWHQGETDVALEMSASEYKTRFLQLLADLTSDGVIDGDTVVIVGGLSEDNADRIAFNQDVLASLASENENIYYARSDGLPSADGTHFTGSSQYVLGADRYFSAYVLTNSDVEGADIFALVNEGGAPGVSGSGINKVLNIKGYPAIGLGEKSIDGTAAFAGIAPPDRLLTPAMLAAGSITEWVSSPSGGVIRFEMGLQICFRSGTAVRGADSFLGDTWTFEKPFADAEVPKIFITPDYTGQVGMSSLELENSLPSYVNADSESVVVRFFSADRYTGGNEAMGYSAFALGFWK